MTLSHELFQAANRELGSFLERIDRLVHGAGEIHASELRSVCRLVAALEPDVNAASRSASGDQLLRAQLKLYADNLKTIDASLHRVRCVMLARRARVDAAQRHVNGLRGWMNAYRRTSPGGGQ